MVPAEILKPGVAAPVRAALGQPVLHFLLAGALLFAGDRVVAMQGWFSKPVIVITAAEQARRAQAWSMQTGRAPNVAERRLLADQAVEDEVLFREALRRGFDRDNPTVRKRLVDVMSFITGPDARAPGGDEELVQKALSLKIDTTDFAIRRYLILQMRLLAELPMHPSPVTDTELENALHRHAGEFLRPARLSFAHAFFSTDARGDHARADAERALAALRHRDRADGEALGDPFPGGNRMAAVSHQSLITAFGEPLAQQIPRLSEGVWSGPFASVYGWHLFRVHERQSPTLPSVSDARPRLLEILRSERAQARFAEYYPQLRARYAVHVEDANAVSATQALGPMLPTPPETLD